MTAPIAVPAVALFEAFLRDNRITRRKAAADLGVSHGVVCFWCNGKLRPGPLLWPVIERWTGGKVPATAWETDADRADRARRESVRPFEPTRAA